MGSYLGSTEETSADFCLEVSVLLSVCAFRHCLSGRPSRVEADLQRPKCFLLVQILRDQVMILFVDLGK